MKVTFDGGVECDYKLDWKSLSPEGWFLAAVAIPNPPNYPFFGDVIDRQVDVLRTFKKIFFDGHRQTVNG